jgi:exosortase A
VNARWSAAAIVWIAAFGLVLIVYLPTWREMIGLWGSTDSYTHGPMVPLISGWLIWRLRSTLFNRHTPSPSTLGAASLIACALMWALGDLIQVAAIRHFAVMLMVIALTYAVFGVSIFKAIFFPLFFLLFAVPFGDFLTEPMMEQTADFTVLALQWSGIPVYREARHIQIPTGNWAVVEACSGTRYLIASVMLGSLFAYLFYRSARKRMLFAAASIIIPIIGNWVRAYLIVMVGHLSKNQYGVGADHVLFGWVFFGVLIYAMFAIGARWREDVDDDSNQGLDVIKSAPQVPFSRWIPMGIATILLALVPTLSSHSATDVTSLVDRPLVAAQAWSHATPPTWRPAVSGARTEQSVSITSPQASVVSLYRGVFAGQRAENRMLRFGNGFLDQSTIGSAAISNALVSKTLGNRAGEVSEIRVPQGNQFRLIRGTYLVGESFSGSAYRAKLYLVLHQLTGRGDRSTVIVWSALADDEPQARQRLDAFEQAYGAQLISER